MDGGNGDDILAGGPGIDSMSGETDARSHGGKDTFVFEAPLDASTNVDRIVFFEADDLDKVALAPAIFAAVFSHGTAALDASEFRSSPLGNAADADDFILFATGTNTLYYDADGNGPGAKVPFAIFIGLIGTLDSTDFTTPPPF